MQLFAVGDDAADSGVIVQGHVVAAGVVDLWHQHAVGQGHFVADAVDTGGGHQQLFEGGEGLVNPVAIPASLLLVVGPEVLFQIVEHPQIVERVNITGDHVDDLAHPGPRVGGRGHQGVGGIGLVKVLHDGDRLTDLHIAIHQKRHQPLRVDPAIGLLALLALPQIDGMLLVGESLKLQHDPYPKTCRRTPIAKQLQHNLSLHLIWARSPAGAHHLPPCVSGTG